VPNQVVTISGDEGEHRVAVAPETIDQIRFGLSAEGCRHNLADCRSIIGSFIANGYWHRSSAIPVANKSLERPSLCSLSKPQLHRGPALSIRAATPGRSAARSA
jgi:hypothetical protein